jgi:cyclomaltodextrinase
MIQFALLAAGCLQNDGKVDYTFAYTPDRNVSSVHLAGTFNNWDRAAQPMRLDGGTWKATLRLAAGRYLYKFVLDGKDWITDPKAKRNEDDGGGNVNSVLMLVPPDYVKPAQAGDGTIARSALFHDRNIPSLNWDKGKLTVSLRTRPGDLSQIEMFLEDPKGEKCVELHEAARDDLYAHNQATVAWDRKKDLKYRFMLVDGATRLYYTPAGVSEAPGQPFVLKAKGFKPFVTPNWVEKSVFYQIFPDRFANGDASNDPKNVQKWTDSPTYSNRFGGDVAGIRKHLSYLKDLGITGIYLNPVFASPSNHRYDATDYLRIDPEFGTNAEFDSLVQLLKSSGIRTMMDFAFNHTAVNFKPFLDIREKGRESAYKDWYWIKEYPVVVKENPPYVAWYNFPSMPKLNVMNPATHAYVLSVVDYWRKNAGIEGLRLDVANEVDQQMWRDLRSHVKAEDPNAYILGEEWGNASKWLQGDQWDASMNYPFRDACLRFFAEQGIGAKEFTNRLMANYRQYAPQVSRVQYNLISSHDTPRFLSLCNGDSARANLAATVLLTWVGVPSIYYGEELGMEGGRDPENRRGMEWNRASASNRTLAYYQSLIKLRKSSTALQSGEPRILLANDSEGTVAYSRESDDDVAIVALNRSAQTRSVGIPTPITVSARTLRDGLTGRTYNVSGKKVQVSLQPMSAVILRPVRRTLLRPRGAAFTPTASSHIQSRPMGVRRK